LTIRRAQLEILARRNDAGAEDRALRHLRNCIPEVCASLSEDELRGIVQWGRKRSLSYGVDREVDFFRYLNLMFMFGFQFDTDPRYPWAARTLAAEKHSRAKIDLLMDHAMLFCSRNAKVQSQ
jgi:hypothetical protein